MFVSVNVIKAIILYILQEKGAVFYLNFGAPQACNKNYTPGTKEAYVSAMMTVCAFLWHMALSVWDMVETSDWLRK